ncbi:MAG: PfkB family carbohydrate kinase, partial [Anaerolineae bacterium]|nr:PfkB family carbohydrate kinase [Anaerolineae bacterium]
RILHHAGATLVALSMGAQGMVLAYPGDRSYHVLHIIPPQVQIRQPTGAGDALLAGILFALYHEMPIPVAARWGVASGTAAAMQSGVGTGTYSEIQMLAEQCSVAAEWSFDE